MDNLTEEQILALFAESLELLELRDPRRDFRATAWQYTFTTSMQEQDNPADFRWRCLHSDNPASNRFAGPDCRQLSDVRAARVTSEETMFARSGRQPPRFVIQPQNVRSAEGETAKLHAKAEGVPSPSYQWFAVDRAGNGQIIANGTDAELIVQNPPLGLSRYVVRVSNSLGDITSEVATLSVEQKLRLQPSPRIETSVPKRKINYSAEFEKLNQTIDASGTRPGRRIPMWLLISIIVVASIASAIVWKTISSKLQSAKQPTSDMGGEKQDMNSKKEKLANGSGLSTPQIEPTEGLVREGTNFTFKVKLTNESGISFQWRQDDVDIPRATSSTLIVSNTSNTNSSHHFVVVISQAGISATSSVATLEFSPKSGPLGDPNVKTSK